MHIDEMEVTARLGNCLRKEGLLTTDQMAATSHASLLRIANFGRKSVNELAGLFEKMGIEGHATWPTPTPVSVKKTIGNGKPGPGRPKGVPNKATTALKDMILKALDDAGGIAYLALQARDNPTAFMTLVGKVLPLQVSGAGEDGEHLHKVSGALVWQPPQP